MLKRRLLALVSAVVMLASLIPLAAFSASAEMGGDFPWTEEQTLVEQILERDGLIDGIWYPWINAGKIGHNLTGNDLFTKYHGNEWARVEFDYHGADNIYREIYNLKAMGYNMMAWGGSVYGEGVIFDEYGDVLGIKQEYLDNTRRLLDICREVGMPVLWNIYFHGSSVSDYYSQYTWSILSQMLCNPEISQHYAERFVAPLCDVLAEYPDVVAMISIADEPENETNDSDQGTDFDSREMFGVNVDDMYHFLYGINEVVKEKMPGVPRTVCASGANKTLYRGFDLDLMGANVYANSMSASENEYFVSYADIILTEYNVGGEFPGDDAAMGEAQIKWRQNMIARGQKGGFQWAFIPNCAYVNDSAHYLLYSRYDNTAFRETSIILRHYMDDYRAEWRGETITLDKPVLLANDSTGVVDWIPSRQATSFDLLRSDDGGESWKTLLENADPANYLNRGMGTYRDTDTTRPASGYIYKVVVRDDKGNVVESEPNDPAGTDQQFKVTYKAPVIDYPTNLEYQQATLKKDQADLTSFGVSSNRVYQAENNLILNPSFEDATGGQWNVNTFLGDNVKVVTDTSSPAGDKVLHLNTKGNAEGSWYKFKVEGLKPNTEYVFSTWVKGNFLSAENKGLASIGTIDHETGLFMIYHPRYTRASRQTRQIYPVAWDGEWHLRSVMFQTGEHTDVEIALYGENTEMWVDDMHLYENGQGIKYSSGRNENIRTYPDWHFAFCDPKDSLTDVTVDEDDFWQTGDGWKQGFMSLEESDTGYGNALKYTSNSNSTGLFYLKWIDVEPNTKYYISFNIKILETGLGRVTLMDSKLTKPVDAFCMDLDQEVYGTDWFPYSGKFDSGLHDQVGFGVCDLGGSALIDNIRLFKVDDEIETLDLYLDASKVTNNVTYGKNASVTANATGDGLTYKWYFKDKNSSKFSLTTAFTGATYSIAMNEARDGRQVYCVVTDKYGTSRTTEVTTLKMKPTALKITTQPKTSTYVKDGATAKVTVKAQGDGLKYTWYYKNAGKTSYSKSSVTSATYSVKMSASASDRRLYCVVTDAYGNSVKTTTAVIRRQVAITKQPATAAYAKNGAKASVKITANGDGLKYAWYVKNAGASKYSKSSITSATYSATMSSTTKDRRVYCVVTDKYGKSVTSKTFILRMTASITTEPKTVTVKKNATAKVTVKAKGDGLKYTWYVKNEGAKKYSKSSITKSTYSVKMTSKVKNRLVYCVVTDKYGNKVQSKTVRLKMK